jgi:hypothetical protein
MEILSGCAPMANRMLGRSGGGGATTKSQNSRTCSGKHRIAASVLSPTIHMGHSLSDALEGRVGCEKASDVNRRWSLEYF